MPPTRGGKSLVTRRVLGNVHDADNGRRGGCPTTLPSRTTSPRCSRAAGSSTCPTGARCGSQGADAVSWLHDLLTADVAGLEPGRSGRSLLLTPTGRIRADVQVLRRDDDVVLVQSPEQPDHIGLLLSPYILSSDVLLEDATDLAGSVRDPGRGASVVGLPGTVPSVLGPGVDLLAASGKAAWRAGDALVKADLVEVEPPGRGRLADPDRRAADGRRLPARIAAVRGWAR